MLKSAFRKIPLCLILFLFLPCPGFTGALEFSISGDKLSVHADQCPLQEILNSIAEYGIRVRIDPMINPSISISFRDRELKEGLKSILKSLNHVLIWESIQVPDGTLPLLAEIQVFQPGKKEDMRALDQGSVLSLETGPKGTLFVKNEILIKMKDGFTSRDLQRLLDIINGRVIDYYTATGIYRILLQDNSDVPGIAEGLLKNSDISGVEPNHAYPLFRPYRGGFNGTDSSVFPQVSVSEDSVPVAIIDTGLMNGTELDRLIAASLDTLQPGKPISDNQGHGTQMAYIASGMVDPSGITDDSGFYSPIIPIRAFDDNGFTTGFQMMQGIDFAIRNGARVMSLSWGSGTRSGFLEEALEQAASEGLIIVASAGNEPTGKPVYPAAYPSVIGVGALGPDGRIWEQSNSGSFVTLYAPGFASLPVGYKGEAGTYAGTSIAAAFTANRIAEYISKHPYSGTQEIFKALRPKLKP